MSGTAIVVAALVFYALGAVMPLVLPSPRAIIAGACAFAAIGSFAALVAGLTILSGATVPPLLLPSALPFGPLIVQPDDLSSLFLCIIGLVGLAVAVYSFGYLPAFVGHRDLRLFGVLLNALLLTLVLVVVAADAVLFLIGWEIMAWLSYFAVNYEHEDPSVTRAGLKMLVISELGTVGVIAAFLLLAGSGGQLTFAAMRSVAATLPGTTRDIIFLAALFGFGAKAGVLPLQLWLPDAYAAAPGNVSALLSGILSKLGIYGIARFALDLLGVGPSWWGLLLLVLGAATALIGILYAVVQLDLKRVLAYSSIENLGIILVGLGASMVFRTWGLLPLAAIAAIAALYHVLNHATYKGLLFLAAGAVDRATGSRDLERLGGLVHRLPWTAALFLVGALAIAGVPPLNGYISEWMTLEVLLRTNAVPDAASRIIIAVAGPAVALTAGFAVTAFVRAFGVTFVGIPRSPGAAQAREVARSMRFGMGLLAAACFVLGVLPTFILPLLDRVTTSLLGTSVANQVVPPLFSDQPGPYAPLAGIGGTLFRGLPVNGLVVIAAPTLSTITAPTYLLLAEGLFLVLTLAGLRLLRPLGSRRVGPVWAGGIPAVTARMQYSALAYANPVRLIFQGLYRSRHVFEGISPAARHLAGQIVYTQDIPDPFERELYRPVLKATRWISQRALVIQSGSVNQYVGYIFLIVVLVLVLRLLP